MPRRSRRRRRPTSRLRLPIALKFALAIAALSVALMAWQAHTAIQRAGAHLEREANVAGLRLTSAIALLLRPEWFRGEGEPGDLDAILRRLQADAGTSDIRSIVLFDPRGEAVALLGEIRLSAGERISFAPAEAIGVTIEEHEADGVPVRTFRRPVSVQEGEPGEGSLGEVAVMLSAATIRNSQRELSSKLTQVTLLASLAAAVTSFLLASFLTQGIRGLLRDLKQVSRGNLGHQSTIDSGDEIGDLARTFNHMTSQLEVAQDTRLRQQAIEQELALATRIQSRLLPPELPDLEGFELAAYYISAKEVGGDYYDFIPVDAERLGLVVADVSGKGVPGSLLMAMTRSLMRLAGEGDPDPVRAVRRVNRGLASDLESGMFVTLSYAVLDSRRREVELVRAGHLAPLHFQARLASLSERSPRGIAIGLDTSGQLFDRELDSESIPLESGDLLIFYTDGVIEGMNRHQEEFGLERLASIVREHARLDAQAILDEIMDALEAWERGVERSDDITLVVLKAR